MDEIVYNAMPESERVGLLNGLGETVAPGTQHLKKCTFQELPVVTREALVSRGVVVPSPAEPVGALTAAQKKAEKAKKARAEKARKAREAKRRGFAAVQKGA